MNCFRCGAEVDNDAMGAYRRFKDRRATEFMCLRCFCEYLGCTEEFMKERIEFLKKTGCAMFITGNDTISH